MKLGIYGSGGLGKEIREIAVLLNKYDEIIFIDDFSNKKSLKNSKMMPFKIFKELYNPNEVEIIIGVANPKHRKELYNKVKAANYAFTNIIHPHSYISEDAKIGIGVIIEMGAYIGFDVTIGDNSFISGNSCIGHDCLLQGHDTILQYSILGGGCNVGNSSFVGQGSIIRERTKLGDNSVISMGSVVFSDVPSDMIVMGNPARVIGKNTGESLFQWKI